MKTTFTCLAIFFAVTLSGQAPGFLVDSIQYVTDDEAAFMMDKKTRFMFRTNHLGLEWKVGKAFSLGFASFFDFNFADSLTSGGINAGAELRYYFKMKNRMKLGLQEDNLSGDYVSLMPFAGIGIIGNRVDSSDISSTRGLRVALGSQYRYKNYEYFDFRVTGEYMTSEFIDPRRPAFSGWSISSRAFYGLALGKRHDFRDGVDCNVIRCHVDRKSALKLDQTKPFEISRFNIEGVDDPVWSLSFRTKLSYEHKLGNSVFSLDHSVGTFQKYSNEGGNLSAVSSSLSIESGARYYSQMKGKIREGESGNNLNGFYFTSTFRLDTRTLFQNLFSPTPKVEVNQLTFNLGLGHQRILFDKIYLDVSVKIGRVIHSNSNARIASFLDVGIGRVF